LANDLYTGINVGGSAGVVLQSSPNSHQHHPTTFSPYPQNHLSTPTKNNNVSSSSSSAASFASVDNGPVVPLPVPMPPSSSSSSSGHGTPYTNNIPALAPRVDTRTSPTFSYDRSKSNGSRAQASSTPSPPSKYNRPRASTHINDHRPDVVVESCPSYSFGRTSSSTSQESATRSSKQQQKSKFPHGLTVQELKEMTKARLQAEASTVDLRVDNESSTRGGRNLQTPEPFGPSSTVNNAQASPVSPGFHVSNSPRDGWSQGATDAWDNASVSTCASDAYLSSEQYLSNGSTQNFDDYNNATAFVRSRSYPVSASNSGNCSFDVPSQVHAFSSNNHHTYYDGSSSYGGAAANRRRAQTMSPRIGLSYVHEDRPVVGDAASMHHHNLVSFPQEQQAPHSKHQHQPCRQQQQRPLAVPSLSAFTPSPFRYGGIHSNNGTTAINNANSGGIYGGGDVGGGDSNNRQRAFSTTSLPSATSTTADEFGICSSSSSSHRFASPFGAVREDAPLAAPPPPTGLAEVFRGSGSGLSSSSSTALPPSGLICGTQGLSISTVSSGGHLYPGNIGDSRNRSATWSEPASSADIFSGLLCNEQLSDDLASILKLSGASEDKTSSSSGWEQLFSHHRSPPPPPPGM
jgi:hypothetical protein